MLRMYTLHVVLILMMGFMKASSDDDICTQHEVNTCAECISKHFTCSWCSDKDFTNATRCQTTGGLQAAGCRSIEEPSNELNIAENKVVEDDPPVQVQPQKIELKVRPNKQTTFNLTFRAANNYPVDLYFLFDISNTMRTNIEKFADVAGDIADEIGDETENFAMAYGAFQDKVIMPFTNTQPNTLKDACYGRDQPCGPPIDFKHLHEMTNDSNELIARIRKSKNETTGNLDHPEGGLEAIIQVIACKEQVKWRNDSRKLLIYASDDRFHLAGDGRLAGIVIPNDLKCHLDDNGKYTAGLTQDYPSVGQLSNLTQKEDIHIIFIVGKHPDKYLLLSERIPSSNVETVSSNEGIKQLVVDKYKSIVSKVKMLWEMNEPKIEGVDIDIKTKNCSNAGKDSNECNGIKIGQKIEFEVTVKVSKCPDNPQQRRKIIQIYPEKLKRDTLTLELDIICECECFTDATSWQINSELCNHGNGTLKCGVCDCHDGRRGDTCECDADNTDESDIAMTDKCKTGDNEECNGQGFCDCGKCTCNADFSGRLCECINSNCTTSDDGKVCGGSSRGYCGCSVCRCLPGYKGDACDCPISNSSCMHDGEVCSGHGVCDCGKCTCDDKYAGSTCQKCYLCSDTCSDTSFRKCAVCEHDSQDNADVDCSGPCAEIEKVVLVERFSENNTNYCHHKLPDSCLLTYKVESVEQMLHMKILKKKACPEPLDVWSIVAAIIGSVVLIALVLLLIGKCVTMIYDHREYSKFQEDMKNSQWAQQDNPVYKQATTTHMNPMMERGDVEDVPLKE